MLKDLTSSQYLRVSQLLDESLDMTPAERDHWLAALEVSDPRAAIVLRELFDSQRASDAAGFLQEQGQLARELESATESVTGMVGKQFGAYRVLSLLGHGGMGSVWLAERTDGLFSRRVALKLVHPALVDRVMTERFVREREILASLTHPNIARLLDAGLAEDGQSYLALEYVAGTPLTTFCDDRRLSITQRLDLFRQVLRAVEYAHANLVIHRDLKPSNILVTEDSRAHLLDFGIAKLLTGQTAKETELTQIGGRALTLDYAAPEQVAGTPITTATDVYSLGVMLYELLTGERPYRLKRNTRGALEEAILHEDPLPPSRASLSEATAAARSATRGKLVKNLRGDLDTIVLKALKKLPGERYATVNAFDADILRFLRSDLVLAQPDSVAYRASKFVRRHRVAISAAALLLLTLAGGLTATTYEAGLAAKQRDAALGAHFRLLTQTAAERVRLADVSDGMGIILEVLKHGAAGGKTYSPEALSVFQEARASDAQVLVIAGHTERVRSASFAPDGKRIVTASFDRTARVWDATTGREVMQLIGHTDALRSAAFSPDGRYVVTAALDKTARIWDARTGQQLLQLNGHTEGVRSAEFSPDGSRVVTSSYDLTARIWDAAAGQQLQQLTGHSGPVVWASFSPDGGRVLTASQDRTARIWDAATGKQLVLLNGHTGQLTSAAFSPDGRRVVTASYDKTARIWDATTGQQLTLLSGHTQLLEHVEFSHDGSRIVTVSDDKTGRVWDADTGRQLALLVGHTEPLTGAAFSPDGRHVVTSSDDMTARVWNSLPGPEGVVLRGHTQVVAGAEFSPDGRRVATASADKTARIWDATTGQQLTLLSGHTQLVLSAIFSADGRRVITASDDSTARIWDSTTRRELLTLSGHTQAVEGAAFTPDGKLIVTASSDKTVRLWDASTGRQLRELDGHTGKVNWAMFSPDGHRVVTASYDKTARVWDAASGRQLMVFAGHSGPVATAAFSPDGQRIVTASDDKTARVWDVAGGRELVLLSGHDQPVTSAAFSSDGRRVVTSSYDKTARVWDAASGQQLMAVVLPDLVETASFSPDGERIVTASDDKTAGIWDVRAPPLEQQIQWAEAAQFEPLSSTERFQLGLPEQVAGDRWPKRSRCDVAAAAPYDPDRRAQGVVRDLIVAEIALEACSARQLGPRANEPRSIYQHGRALWKSGDTSGARRDFEQAAAAGYHAASVDLAMLLSSPAAKMLDVPRAIALYERAWKDGVSFAGFELGALYERGVRSPGPNGNYALAPDATQAWSWYQEAADAKEPHALARFAERYDDAALSMDNLASRASALLTAFARYAAAAEKARQEDWPDASWRNWRYRRACLARVLARDGLMYDVAGSYDSVR
ncbi:MAG TPA: protein kinase [Steroidobacteraceae bacterium]